MNDLQLLQKQTQIHTYFNTKKRKYDDGFKWLMQTIPASTMDPQGKKYNAQHNNASISSDSDVYEPASSNNSKRRRALIEWLNGILPDLSLPINASDEELRVFLVDGSILCQILDKLKPGYVTKFHDSLHSSKSSPENVQRFLSAIDNMGLPRFESADLEKGSMKLVLDCLSTLQTHFTLSVGIDNKSDPPLGLLSSQSVVEERQKLVPGLRLQRSLCSSVMKEPTPAFTNHVGQKVHEVFQLKQGSCTDLSSAKISEIMKSNSFDTAPTQTLVSVVSRILEESIERKNGEIPNRVACILRKGLQEIDRRICTQAQHLRMQNNLFKAREEKYQSRIKVLEALATGTAEETQIVTTHLQQIKGKKKKIEEKCQGEDMDVQKLVEQKEQDFNEQVKEMEKDFQMVLHEKEKYFQENMREKQQDLQMLMKEKDVLCNEMENLRQELEVTKQSCQQLTLKTKVEAGGVQQELEGRLKETLGLLAGSTNRIEELEAASKSKAEWWNKKQHIYKIFIEFMLGALRELRFASQSIQQDILRTKKSYSEEFSILGSRIKVLDDAAKSYYSLLAENQKIHNELQELKGNIRVYCRIRPFLTGQKGKQSIVEYVGDNGELIIANPSKPGKEGRRSFKFNKVYGLSATQAEVFSDIKPLVQSVLDGYNVCIFAYGQTGSGKTYTMTGPDGGSEEEWGVNYRALNNLFHVSQSRESSFTYEISVQMVEIYNEQVRDLLSNDATQKRLGVSSTMQASGLAVPDASIHTVKSTSGVLELMDAGLKNRAKSSTALNERSSRSHSVLSIHVRGMDLKSGSSLRGSLHLVDLAGSERVDRSEVTGDRLKEAQHINKSLSALGDVIFALAQKSSHIPYRNSKLTQVLQSSLGGQAKTLMFVQVNPDAASHSESSSTLKFAERVSGVELGAAKSSKDGRDVRELMEQVASLKDTIAKKDEEIEMLQLLKDPKNVGNGERRSTPTPSAETNSS